MIRTLALVALLGLLASPIRGQEAKPKPTRDKWNVAIVVHGPVRWTHPRFEAVLDSVSAALAEGGPIASATAKPRT